MVHRPHCNQRPSEALAGPAARLVYAAGLGIVDDMTEGRCGGTLSAWGTDHLAATDSFTSPDGAGWWVDRVRFDAALRDRCAALGVAVVTGRVTGVRREQHCWMVSLAGGAQTMADWVIDATGRVGAVARCLGASRQPGPALVAVHARTSGVDESVPSRVFLEAEPDGWWYVGASSRHRIGATAVVQPSDARWLLTAEHFVGRLGQTRHLSRWAGQHGGWNAPRTSPASSSALDRVFGEGWIACGDAAMALDPISGQGLVGALAGGLVAAQAICSSDTSTQMRRIATRHADVLRIYKRRRTAAYRREHRWPEQPFWATQSSGRGQERGPAAVRDARCVRGMLFD
jgi:flavin-dependent dehydrogenase